jgi:hypothetical protein
VCDEDQVCIQRKLQLASGSAVLGLLAVGGVSYRSVVKAGEDDSTQIKTVVILGPFSFCLSLALPDGASGATTLKARIPARSTEGCWKWHRTQW